MRYEWIQLFFYVINVALSIQEEKYNSPSELTIDSARP